MGRQRPALGDPPWTTHPGDPAWATQPGRGRPTWGDGATQSPRSYPPCKVYMHIYTYLYYIYIYQYFRRDVFILSRQLLRVRRRLFHHGLKHDGLMSITSRTNLLTSSPRAPHDYSARVVQVARRIGNRFAKDEKCFVGDMNRFVEDVNKSLRDVNRYIII